LFRSLYRRGWKAEQIRHLYDFIDWVVDLPEELDDKLWEEMREYEEEINMPYVNSAERYGIKKGITKGRRAGRREHAVAIAVRLANHKLGKLSAELESQVKGLSLRKLDQLTVAVLNFTGIEDLTTWLQAQSS
jgi:hypothetical protein